MLELHTDQNWPPLQILPRLIMALAVGLFVGLEREWRGKEAGLRTFGFASLLGGIGGLLGEAYGLLCIGLLGVPIIFLNIQSIRKEEGSELTTSAALLVMGMTGILCGRGHTVTPAAIAVVTAGLLAWKEWLANFSHRLTVNELRSAILLAILAFAIYPLLPVEAVDPWSVVNLRSAWATVILIAAVGFVNYLLWKAFGTKGLELTGFFGGLVNSTVTVTELAKNVRLTGGRMADVAYESILFATGAMALRNSLVLAIIMLPALGASWLPLLFLLVPCFALGYLGRKNTRSVISPLTPPLESPFSFVSAIKFGGLFLLLKVIGVIAARYLGHLGFLAVSAVGGLVSSASAAASAASLAGHGEVTPETAGLGVVLASLASAGVNVVIVGRVAQNKTLTKKLAGSIGAILFLCALAAAVQHRFHLRIS